MGLSVHIPSDCTSSINGEGSSEGAEERAELGSAGAEELGSAGTEGRVESGSLSVYMHN